MKTSSSNILLPIFMQTTVHILAMKTKYSTCFLYALEIPYSVSVVSSMNFSFTVMPFDEPRSYAALQIICDCLLIKRIQAQSNMQSIIQGIIEQYSHFQMSNMFKQNHGQNPFSLMRNFHSVLFSSSLQNLLVKILFFSFF